MFLFPFQFFFFLVFTSNILFAYVVRGGSYYKYCREKQLYPPYKICVRGNFKLRLPHAVPSNLELAWKKRTPRSRGVQAGNWRGPRDIDIRSPLTMPRNLLLETGGTDQLGEGAEELGSSLRMHSIRAALA